MCTASAWISPICIFHGPQALLLNWQTLKGSMKINYEYGVSDEMLNNWIFGKRLRDREKMNMKISNIICDVLLSALVIFSLFSLYLIKNGYEKMVIYPFSGVIIIAGLSAFCIRLLNWNTYKALKKGIRDDLEFLDIFCGESISEEKIKNSNFDTVRLAVISHLRMHMTTAVVDHNEKSKENILKALSIARLFFGWIGESEIFSFHQLSWNDNGSGTVVCDGKKYSYEMYSVDHPVDVKDIYRFATYDPNNCTLLGQRGFTWVRPPIGNNRGDMFCFSQAFTDDGINRYTIHTRNRITGSTETITSIPEAEFDQSFFRGKILVVFKRIEV